MTVKDNLNELLKVKNETDSSAELYFYGDIVSDWEGGWSSEDQYPKAIRDFLKNSEGKDLNIYINSGGGSVFAGMAIYNMLKRHSGKKTVHVDGIAASIASVIALAGDVIVIPANAYLMIHKPFAPCIGNSDEMLKMAANLEAIEDGIINVYKEHLRDGADIEEIRQMVQAETWLTGDEAAKYFDITTAAPKEYAACISGEARFKNTPEKVIKSAQAAFDTADIAEKIKRVEIGSIMKGVQNL